jgi:hypothetical protein
MALQEDLSLGWGDFKVTLVVWVEKHGHLSDLTIETVFLNLKLTIILEVILLQDHD